MGSDEVILLDTHVALWVISDSRLLGRRTRLSCDKPEKPDSLPSAP
jgi:PIN domain nuclease of toxin-antitoxin system